MQNVADMADLGVATAYRHFSTLEDVFNGVLLRRIELLERSTRNLNEDGADLFRQTVAHWFEVIESDGDLLVRARSRRGFLARLHGGDPVISAVARTWSRPISELLRAERIAGVTEEEALYFFNVLFDPRDVLELIASRPAIPNVQHRLVAAYIAMLQTWGSTG